MLCSRLTVLFFAGCNTSTGANELLKSVLFDLLDQLNTILKYDLEDEAKEEEAQFRKASILLVTICTSLSSQLARGPEAQQVSITANSVKFNRVKFVIARNVGKVSQFRQVFKLMVFRNRLSSPLQNNRSLAL